MSSFPKHEDNIRALHVMGFDVSEAIDENGNITMDSWGYDELVDLMGNIIDVLDNQEFQVKQVKG